VKRFPKTLPILALLLGCLQGGAAMGFSLSSPSFAEGAPIPKKQTCDGSDLSPPLVWQGAPAGTKAFALVVDDPDAPPGTWVHWVIYDIPGDVKGLEEGVPKTETLANGAKQGMAWGVDRFNKLGYTGPCPPPGATHRYYFKLTALDAPLGLPPKAGKFDVEKAMKGHVLAETQLMGRYGR
jgi:hypothetical protein